MERGHGEGQGRGEKGFPVLRENTEGTESGQISEVKTGVLTVDSLSFRTFFLEN